MILNKKKRRSGVWTKERFNENQSKGDMMKRKIVIEMEKEIEEYWLLRGVQDDGVQKRVMAERN